MLVIKVLLDLLVLSHVLECSRCICFVYKLVFSLVELLFMHITILVLNN